MHGRPPPLPLLKRRVVLPISDGAMSPRSVGRGYGRVGPDTPRRCRPCAGRSAASARVARVMVGVALATFTVVGFGGYLERGRHAVMTEVARRPLHVAAIATTVQPDIDHRSERVAPAMNVHVVRPDIGRRPTATTYSHSSSPVVARPWAAMRDLLCPGQVPQLRWARPIFEAAQRVLGMAPRRLHGMEIRFHNFVAPRYATWMASNHPCSAGTRALYQGAACQSRH